MTNASRCEGREAHAWCASVAYGTYLSGSGIDKVGGIVVDRAGAAYVAGESGSTNLQLGGAPGFDRTPNGGGDALVASLVVLATTANATGTPAMGGTPTATTVALPVASACGPRPPIVVQMAPTGDGRLRATIAAAGPNNAIRSVRFVGRPGR